MNSDPLPPSSTLSIDELEAQIQHTLGATRNWAPQSRTFVLGSLRLALTIPESYAPVYAERYGAFGPDGTTADPDFSLEMGLDDTLDLGRVHVFSMTVQNGADVFYAYRWDFILRIDLRRRSASVVLTRHSDPNAFDSALRIVTSVVAIVHGGFLVHGAAIADRGDGFVFFGVSGSGKSTLSKLSLEGGKEVLTDEMCLIERGDTGKWMVRGTPFHGEMRVGVNRAMPLAGMFQLVKSPDVKIQSLHVAAALQEFMRVVVCFTTANQGFLDNLLCQVETLLREVPLNALLLRKDLTCWDHIHANEQLP